MTEKRYLKWYNKVGYGSGDIAGNVVYAFLSSFVMIYLTNTVGPVSYTHLDVYKRQPSVPAPSVPPPSQGCGPGERVYPLDSTPARIVLYEKIMKVYRGEA